MKKLQSIGIIPDGNRRWARSRGLPTIEGHRKGVLKLREVGDWCIEKGVSTLTVFGFSSENRNRSKEEIDYLIKIIYHYISSRSLKDLKKRGIQINIIGDLTFFPQKVRDAVKRAEDETKENKEMTLNVALNYGGRSEIVSVAKKLIEKGIEFTEENFSSNLFINTFPDLIIRTGREVRISNFMLWQAAYSELYFSNSYWPEFSKKEFDDAFEYYAKKERRFGQ